jgi:hypothetical protein
MPKKEIQLYRIKFGHSDFLKLPEEDHLFLFGSRMWRTNLRHTFSLCVAAEKGTRSQSADERKLALHQLLFAVRLVYGILTEGWKLIKQSWSEKALGKRWHPLLTEKGRNGLAFLGKCFGKRNLARTIRDNFGFHYLAERLRAPLAGVSPQAGEIISGKYHS